ncbi:MAG: hypothetical protein U0271_43725 [Polyangiaceae bacterium]
MLRARWTLPLGLCLLPVVASCQDDTDTDTNPQPAAPVEAVYTVPASLDELSEETFFDHPYPSDLRLVDGKTKLLGWPNPRHVPLLKQYIEFIDGQLSGFSPLAAGFMRFSGGLDPATLPDAAGSLESSASVQLVDITPDSPDYGKRTPIYVEFHKDQGVYWQPNTLAFMPVPGYPLRPKTQYALVVTTAVKAEDGKDLVAPATLKQVLGLEDTSDAAVAAYRDSVAHAIVELESLGLDAASIVDLTVYTTDDPTEEYFAAAGALPTQIEAPTADPAAWTLRDEASTYDEYEGSYGPSPNYQRGTVPYASFGDGGGFILDDNGIPQIQNTFSLRFSLSVPKAANCPMPANGYPIVMYAHGTTGDYRSYVGDGTAKSLTSQCLAVMGVDQIFHGTRPGAPDNDTTLQILFFNFNNVEAARTNVRQSGLDEVQRARLFTESHMTVPAAITPGGAEIRFDATKLMFFGHSQGSLNGPLFLAGSPAPLGAVLSGASGVMQITLIEKTKPEPSVANLVKTIFLQLLFDEQAEVGVIYPPIALAQTIVDAVDPVNYARSIVLEPKFGGSKSIYQTEGVRADGTGDSYAPPRGGEALAIALGLPIQTPVVHDPQDDVGTLERVTIGPDGLSGNLADGQASGVLGQWIPQGGDGHFVVFDVDAATHQAAGFLRNLADDPVGRVPQPEPEN